MGSMGEKSFWNKIKQFFIDIFSKNGKEKPLLPESTINIARNVEPNVNNEFAMGLKVQTEEKNIYIIQLQKDFEEGKIDEKDISEQDKSKLEELYKEQIEALKKSIESYKNKILKIKNAM